jgi:RimJ/RimL family protein N-acetyltransferase
VAEAGPRAPEVRPATIADALAIATIHVRAWQGAYRGLLPQAYLDDLDPDRRRAEWEASLAATLWPSRGTLVLCEDAAAGTGGGIVGFAGISPTRDTDEDPASVGELQTLYLDPRHWRRGGGTTLLTAARDHLATAGFTTATAWVLETNAKARAFYEHHHWRPDGASKLHDWGSFVVTDVRYRVPLV